MAAGLVAAVAGALTVSAPPARPFAPPPLPGVGTSGTGGTWVAGSPDATRDAGERTYLVLYTKGTSAAAAHAAIRAAGGAIVTENPWVGLATVRSGNPRFVAAALGRAALAGAAPDRAIGWAPGSPSAGPDLAATATSRRSAAAAVGGARRTGALPTTPVKPEPFGARQWDMRMIGATPDGSYRANQGDKRVLVGVVDTGIDGTHPDIAPNFDRTLSRNFTRDLPAVDGPCEHPSCVDPPDEDDQGHGTHVAGIIAAALNGLGIGGVAPGVTLVNLRAGQDSGLFFLEPVVDALTYAGLVGIDVVNLSFYTDPWLYNCPHNPADSPDEQREQRIVIEATQRAVDFARAHGVTPIAALGNEHRDLDLPRAGTAGSHTVTDDSSPDYPPQSARHRVIDASCLTVPSESRGVLAVSALGPDGRKASYSNWGRDTAVAAPGGDLSGSGDTDRAMRPESAVLSAYPANVARAHHDLRPDGTPADPFTLRDCEHGTCAYYQYLQGTSMAAPHAAGVAALIVSALGHPDPVHGGLTLDPGTVERVLRRSATPTACPALRGADGVRCQGARRRNTVYGYGIVNALRAARARRPSTSTITSVTPEVSGSWWAPRSSKPLRRASPAWRVRFPSTSATCGKALQGSAVTSARAAATAAISTIFLPRRVTARSDHLIELRAGRARPSAIGCT